MVQISRDAGSWTIEKLTLLEKYLSAYVKATQSLRARGNITYVDLFSGPGSNRNRDTGDIIDGSPVIALKLYPGFSRFVFVESDRHNWDSLQIRVSQLGRAREVDTIYGDCNQKIDEIIKKIPTDGPCFVFLDPAAPVLDWTTVSRIANLRVGYRKRRPEQFILFPYDMGLVRMLPRDEEPESVWGSYTRDQISGVMPDSSKWRAVHLARRQGLIDAQEQRRRFLYLYWMGLNELGYQFVLQPRLIKTRNGHRLYDLYFVSDNETGGKIMGSVIKAPAIPVEHQLALFQEESVELVQEDPYDFRVGEKWYLELQGKS